MVASAACQILPGEDSFKDTSATDSGNESSSSPGKNSDGILDVSAGGGALANGLSTPSSYHAIRLLNCLLNSKEKYSSKLVVSLDKIVNVRFYNVDLKSAAKKNAAATMTDAEIANLDSQRSQLVQDNELVQWQPDEDEESTNLSAQMADASLSNGIEGGTSADSGWRADKMFDYNEKKFKVTSSYTDDLQGYT